MSNLSWLNPTPHAPAVYLSCAALLPPHATLASRRPATALPGPDSHRLIAPALAGALSFNDLVGAGEQTRGAAGDSASLPFVGLSLAQTWWVAAPAGRPASRP